jgi:hypothetical protein
VGLDGPVDVGVGSERRGAERLPGGGLERLMGLGAKRVNPLAVDEEPRAVEVDVVVSGQRSAVTVIVALLAIDRCPHAEPAR